MLLSHNFLTYTMYTIHIIASSLLSFFHSFDIVLSIAYLFPKKIFPIHFFDIACNYFYLNVYSLYREFIFINTHAFSMRVIRFPTSLFSIFEKSVASFASY